MELIYVSLPLARSHGQVHGGVEPQPALVRAQGRVVLDAVAAVDLEVAIVVLPRDAELDDALGDRHDPQRRLVLGVLLEQRAVLEGDGELCGRACVSMAMSLVIGYIGDHLLPL